MLTDDLLSAYAESHTTPEPEILAKLNRETHLSQVCPQMLSGHLQGTLLTMIVQMIRPARVLEIGTFTGYSAIAMGLGMMHGTASAPDTPSGPSRQKVRDGSLLHTIEVNPELEDGIRRFIAGAGLESLVVLHIGPAMEVLQTLNDEWDLVFIDADKPNYLNYYNLVFNSVRPGGFIIADNVLWDGKVTEQRENMDKDTLGIVEFNAFIKADERVENLLLPIRDGLMIIRKI